jgi:hypothetical protein
MKTFVTKINDEGIDFDNGANLSSYHRRDCCEKHWLCFEHLTLDDFDGLVFDLSNDGFFERIPGYGSNNGYYLSTLDLVLEDVRGKQIFYDISDCQVISD